MTVIIALKENDEIYVGADRQLTSGDIKSYANDCKIIRKKAPTNKYVFDEDEKEIVVLLTGYAHFTGFMKYVFEPPTIETENDFEYLTKFIKKYREEIQKSCWLEIKEGESNYYGNMILVYNNNIYLVDSVLGLIKSGDLEVGGSGIDVALGSLYSTKGKKPTERIKIAIDCCNKILTSVGEGIDVFKV